MKKVTFALLSLSILAAIPGCYRTSKKKNNKKNGKKVAQLKNNKELA